MKTAEAVVVVDQAANHEPTSKHVSERRRELKTEEDWIQFSANETFAFSLGAGRYQRINEFGIVGIVLSGLTLLTASALQSYITFATPLAVGAGIALGLLVVLMAVSSHKMKWYNRIEGLRVEAYNKKLQQITADSAKEDKVLKKAAAELIESKRERLAQAISAVNNELEPSPDDYALADEVLARLDIVSKPSV